MLAHVREGDSRRHAMHPVHSCARDPPLATSAKTFGDWCSYVITFKRRSMTIVFATVVFARKRMGLRIGFTERELRKAYMTGCRKLAPDKGGDARAFIKLQRAHSILLPFAGRPETAASS